MSRVMKVMILQDKATVKYAIELDGQLFEDSMNCVDIKTAKGIFADEFNYLTQNRYKNPTEELSSGLWLKS